MEETPDFDEMRRVAWENAEKRLNPQQMQFAINRVAGMSNHDAALAAGYSEMTAKHATFRIAQKKEIAEILRVEFEEQGYGFRQQVTNLIDSARNAHKIILDKDGGEHVTPDYSARVRADELIMKAQQVITNGNENGSGGVHVEIHFDRMITAPPQIDVTPS